MLETTPNMASSTDDQNQPDGLVEHLESLIVREYGVVLTGRSLMRVLGYPSLEALRAAIHRGTIPIPVFPLQNRRGKGALASEAARYLANQHRLAEPKKG